MKTKITILIIGLFVIAMLPTTALCEDEITETEVTADSEIALTADLEADDTGPPFLEEIYAAINAGDTALHTEIVSEEAARTSADEALQTEIDEEEAARIAEDEALWAAINNWMSLLAAESAARTNADASLQSQINDIEDILNASSTPLPGVSFGKLVVETEYYEHSILQDFIRNWLDGYGTTADAKLIYKELESPMSISREVHFFGLRPICYYTMGLNHRQHIEFSVEYVDIGHGGDLASACTFDFEFDGYDLSSGTSVKPPEIYFGHVGGHGGFPPQFFDYIPVISSPEFPFGDENDFIISETYHFGDDYWQLGSGADIDVTYVDGNISETKGGDVVLTGIMYGREIVDVWVKSWIDDFENASPEDIIIRYQNSDVYGGRFVDAMPTSYILPPVGWEDCIPYGAPAIDSLSFTYLGVTNW